MQCDGNVAGCTVRQSYGRVVDGNKMIANLDLMHVCDSHGSFESSCALQESAALSCRILLPNLSFGLLARMIERVLSLSTILSLSLLTQKSHQTTHASGTACDHLFHYKVTTARDLMSTLSLRFLYQLRLAEDHSYAAWNLRCCSRTVLSP